MNKRIEFNIEESIVKSINKVLRKISDVSFRGDYNLTDREIEDIHEFIEFTFIDEEEEKHD